MRHKRIYHLSERAITIEWDPVIDTNIHKAVMAFDHEIKQMPFQGWIENVPSYHTLTIYFDPFSTDKNILSEIENRLENFIPGQVLSNRKIKVPVCYDAAFALDMPLITDRLGIPAEEVIRLHIENNYNVYMIGFMPGFPYMGTLNPGLYIERKSNPSTSIPAGSVAIAGFQTGIYPFESPGGWYVIGKTPWILFQNGKSTFEPGDEIEFVRISGQEFNAIQNQL